ncbi:hypothetical protein SAMN05877753_11187 [Bacillus oleivorans]|uniref:Uncharacterized protein n=1 Tax=Bacillus oleivorans TaxID=1448271 RepID=A0A285D5Y1_9BACI|nr:hypothetical protein SAMN05877753_11187 [Bacillus oleivorans]
MPGDIGGLGAQGEICQEKLGDCAHNGRFGRKRRKLGVFSVFMGGDCYNGAVSSNLWAVLECIGRFI